MRFQCHITHPHNDSKELTNALSLLNSYFCNLKFDLVYIISLRFDTNRE